MKVAVIAEHNNNQLALATLNVITAANALNSECTVIVCGDKHLSVIEQLKKVKGVSHVIALSHSRLVQPVAEDLTEALLPVVDGFDVILCGATTFGKNFMPRLAAMLDVNALTDVSAIVDESTFVRPIYAGNVVQTVKSLDAKKVITIRPTAFAAQTEGESANEVTVTDIVPELGEPLSRFITNELSQSVRPDLASARIVVSGGRGLQDKEKFQLIESLADALGAAVGASRAAVDAGFVANDYQVGQTGKIVAPELYIAVGISGAIQHLAGMKDSKIIVAINKDPDAPIFQIATYGLVGDLFEIVPELIRQLQTA